MSEDKVYILMRRLEQEKAQMLHDTDGITKSTGGRLHVFPSRDDPFTFQAVIAGPLNSPYRKGILTLQIKVPEDYPFAAPSFHFETSIWHPNVVLESGKVVLDCFTDAWNPAWTLHSLLLAVFAVMEDPIVDDSPGNEDAADDFRENRIRFVNEAEYMTTIYAGTEKRVTRFMDMGFDKGHALAALVRSDWNEELALDFLLGGDDEITAEEQVLMAEEQAFMAEEQALMAEEEQALMDDASTVDAEMDGRAEVDSSLHEDEAPSTVVEKSDGSQSALYHQAEVDAPLYDDKASPAFVEVSAKAPVLMADASLLEDKPPSTIDTEVDGTCSAEVDALLHEDEAPLTGVENSEGNQTVLYNDAKVDIESPSTGEEDALLREENDPSTVVEVLAESQRAHDDDDDDDDGSNHAGRDEVGSSGGATASSAGSWSFVGDLVDQELRSCQDGSEQTEDWFDLGLCDMV
ncbi:conjugating enzyme E2 [Seminavis robusta]|uniref:Conjugating enzyme E2 n=1 Tax=Seminavis robusta TaxID=568900 RepID=A0A9N8DKP1_9STRA|nr:conjugating enzyme E2 [Seminavis robusta]|eukprot:Sro138_g064610.1 conjugating enzyme E2 (462) ;mRNA; r:13074-14459